jgi:hypothetical protein
MRLLISADDLSQFPVLRNRFDLTEKTISIGQTLHSEAFSPFVADLPRHGKTAFEASMHLSAVLLKQSYHLVLLIGECKARENLQEWLNVIRTVPLYSDKDLSSVYDSGIMDPAKPPHQRGGLINMTNAYFNVFLPIPKVLAYSFPNEELPDKALDNNQIHARTASGLQYASLFHQANFYQLRWSGMIDEEAENSLIRILEAIQ